MITERWLYTQMCLVFLHVVSHFILFKLRKKDSHFTDKETEGQKR